jgi:hypothetical protein
MARSVSSSSRKEVIADVVTTATAKDNVPSGPRPLRAYTFCKLPTDPTTRRSYRPRFNEREFMCVRPQGRKSLRRTDQRARCSLASSASLRIRFSRHVSAAWTTERRRSLESFKVNKQGQTELTLKEARQSSTISYGCIRVSSGCPAFPCIPSVLGAAGVSWSGRGELTLTTR